MLVSKFAFKFAAFNLYRYSTGDYFHVTYSDGDGEDLEEDELVPLLWDGGGGGTAAATKVKYPGRRVRKKFGGKYFYGGELYKLNAGDA